MPMSILKMAFVDLLAFPQLPACSIWINLCFPPCQNTIDPVEYEHQCHEETIWKYSNRDSVKQSIIVQEWLIQWEQKVCLQSKDCSPMIIWVVCVVPMDEFTQNTSNSSLLLHSFSTNAIEPLSLDQPFHLMKYQKALQ